MATSVHIPKPLLEAVDRKARTLQISRNKLIVRALEREITHGSEWSASFFERLADVDEDTAAGVDGILTAIQAARRSKKPSGL